eukprot:TRINITY_DN34030_c0_g2_i1.p1 TRINITY_DN34030_c0_g2~~TRINITY_DN34030_c0_g2_i1.p1  ORF type:complete len:1158 (+),score=223.77 TRINITY_DN34030_c0_g2_i1:59-3532(+)
MSEPSESTFTTPHGDAKVGEDGFISVLPRPASGDPEQAPTETTDGEAARPGSKQKMHNPFSKRRVSTPAISGIPRRRHSLAVAPSTQQVGIRETKNGSFEDKNQPEQTSRQLTSFEQTTTESLQKVLEELQALSMGQTQLSERFQHVEALLQSGDGLKTQSAPPPTQAIPATIPLAAATNHQPPLIASISISEPPVDGMQRGVSNGSSGSDHNFPRASVLSCIAEAPNRSSICSVMSSVSVNGTAARKMSLQLPVPEGLKPGSKTGRQSASRQPSRIDPQESFEDTDTDSDAADWPETVEIRRHEKSTLHRGKTHGHTRTSSAGMAGAQVGATTSMTTKSGGSDGSVKLDTVSAKKFFKVQSLDPNGKTRMLVDLLSLLMVLHDMIAIPWMLAWDIDLQTDVRDTLLCTTLFWTVDIGFSFNTGFYTDGTIERSHRRIALNYIKGWFALDSLMVLTDWVSIIATALENSDKSEGSTATSFKVIRGLKAVKFLRIIGLLRMVRLTGIFEDFLDRNLAGGFKAAFDFVKLVCIMLWLSHVTTCIWFFIGIHTQSAESDDIYGAWFDSVQYLPNGKYFAEADRLFQYTTSFHFALTQITANGVENLTPVNSLERWFNIACLVFGVFFSSHVVSTFSSAMMQLQMENQQKNARLKELSRFLAQHQVNQSLCLRVTRQVKERMNAAKTLAEEDVPALQLLGSNVLAEVRVSMHGKSLRMHELFRFISNTYAGDQLVSELCSLALKVSWAPNGDHIFQAGDDANSAYFLLSGALSYRKRPIKGGDQPEEDEGDEKVDDVVETQVDAGTIISEAALWCLWSHQGDAAAVTDSQMSVVDAEKMLDVLLKYDIAKVISGYKHRYHAHLIAAFPPAAPYPDDLQVAYTDLVDIAATMDDKDQKVFSSVALAFLKERSKWTGLKEQQLEKLEQEVQEGKSLILQDTDGNYERVANVAVLRITTAEKQIFAQVGKFSNTGELTVEVTLPGGKQKRAELPGQVLQRLLFADVLKPILKHIEVVDVTRENFKKHSEQYGIATKYIRTVHHAEISANTDFGMLDAQDSPLPHFPKKSERDAAKVGNLRKVSVAVTAEVGDEEGKEGLAADHRTAYRLGNLLFQALDPEEYDFFSSDAGKQHIKAVAANAASRLPRRSSLAKTSIFRPSSHQS